MSEQAPERIWAVTEPNDVSADIMGDVYAQQTPDGMVGKPVEYVRADLAKPRVKPLKWSQWGNEWDANNPIGGTFTVKIDGHSGFYLFTGENTKATDFWDVVKDRSTPSDCQKQAFKIVERRVLSALILPGGE
jgi:hypothetical protein